MPNARWILFWIVAHELIVLFMTTNLKGSPTQAHAPSLRLHFFSWFDTAQHAAHSFDIWSFPFRALILKFNPCTPHDWIFDVPTTLVTGTHKYILSAWFRFVLATTSTLLSIYFGSVYWSSDLIAHGLNSLIDCVAYWYILDAFIN